MFATSHPSAIAEKVAKSAMFDCECPSLAVSGAGETYMLRASALLYPPITSAVSARCLAVSRRPLQVMASQSGEHCYKWVLDIDDGTHASHLAWDACAAHVR